MLVTGKACKLSTRQVLAAAPGRWHIENTGFNQWVSYWNLNHVFHHTANALLAVLYIWMMAFNLLQLFIYRGSKESTVPKTLPIPSDISSRSCKEKSPRYPDPSPGRRFSPAYERSGGLAERSTLGRPPGYSETESVRHTTQKGPIYIISRHFGILSICILLARCPGEMKSRPLAPGSRKSCFQALQLDKKAKTQYKMQLA
jgi:hypothetical protein